MYTEKHRKEIGDFGKGNMELHRRDYKQSVLDCVV